MIYAAILFLLFHAVLSQGVGKHYCDLEYEQCYECTAGSKQVADCPLGVRKFPLTAIGLLKCKKYCGRVVADNTYIDLVNQRKLLEAQATGNIVVCPIGNTDGKCETCTPEYCSEGRVFEYTRQGRLECGLFCRPLWIEKTTETPTPQPTTPEPTEPTEATP